jgi:hypothetical protein
MRKLLLFCGLVLMLPVLMGVGLGPGLFSGGGGGVSGTLHPASGTDSQICMGENSDHAGGVETVCTTLDAAVDLVRDQDHYINPFGVSGSRIMQSFVDDSGTGHSGVREAVRWFSNKHDVTAGANHLLSGASNPTNLTNQNIGIHSIAGGKLKADALTVRAINIVSANANRCTWQVYKAEAAATISFDPTIDGGMTNWDLCTGEIQMGPTSVNSGGIGDSPLSGSADYYTMPLTNCTCASVDCKMIVTVQDRTPGSITCDSVDDMQVTLFLSEVYP